VSAALRHLGLCGAALGLAACTGVQSSLDARGPAAARIEELWWLLLVATLVPSLITYALLAWATLGPRKRRAFTERGERALILVGGAVIPGVTVFVLFLASQQVQSETARAPAPPTLTIEVIGHQFWWEVRYPDYGIVTANELHLPAGQPVRVLLRSADVIHSFWVPNLHGKRDMMPGSTNELWLLAEEPGLFRGQCAEFCGVQHALMSFYVFALPPRELASWLEDNRRLQTEPELSLERRGLEVYREAECSYCHAIGGLVELEEKGSPGPDLTHLASRRTLAAATLDNNRGNLAGWILDPQTHKLGNRMPASRLAPDDLHALLAFLESLH
jgi:cytochrome c oxidase subunit II